MTESQSEPCPSFDVLVPATSVKPPWLPRFAFQFRTSAVRQFHNLAIAILIFSTSAFAAENCLSIDEAASHIGQMACVTGKVLKVGESRSAHYLDFCASYRRCPFTVVILKSDIKDNSILKQFPGRTLRIYGPIQEYNGRAEIVLKVEEQLSGEPGPYADQLKPRAPRDRRAPPPPGAGLPRQP